MSYIRRRGKGGEGGGDRDGQSSPASCLLRFAAWSTGIGGSNVREEQEPGDGRGGVQAFLFFVLV